MIWRKVSSAKINPINGDLLRSKGHITLHAILSQGDWILSSSISICLSPSGIHLKLKSRKISFAHNFCRRRWILLKFCREHGSQTAVFCAKFQKDSLTQMDVIWKWDLAIFHGKWHFGRIVYSGKGPGPRYTKRWDDLPPDHAKSRTIEALG